MPKLRPNADEFHGFDRDRFRSALPGGDLIAKAGEDPYFRAAVKASWTQRHTENYLEIAQGVVRRIAVTSGVPSYHLAATSRLFAAAQEVVLDPHDVDWNRVAPEAIFGTLRTVDRSLREVGTSVPVLKWFIAVGEAVWKLATYIRAVLEQGEEGGQSPPPKALVYDERTDETITEELLDYAPAKDWTPVFLPFEDLPGAPPFEGRSVDYTDRGLPSGAQVTFGSLGSAGPANPRRAVLPGFARICGPRIQARDLGPGYKFASFTAYTEETGDLLPSAAQTGLTLWHFALKNGPNLWKLNPDRIIDAWQAYFHALSLWATGAWQRGRDEVPEYLLAAVGFVSHWAVPRPHGEPGTLTRGISWKDVPARYKQPPYTTDQLVTWQLRGIWEPRLRRSLGTLTCAYVDESFPALAWAKTSRPELYQRWRDMRALLLRHSARALVDLDLVPEGDWKRELVQVRERTGVTGVAQAPEDGDRPDLEGPGDLEAGAGLPTYDYEPDVPREGGEFGGGGASGSWDDEPAFEPIEPDAPTPDDAPAPVFGEDVARPFPWKAVAAALGLGLLLRG